MNLALAATERTSFRRKLAMLVSGFLLVGSGVALQIRAAIGVAPYDVLTTGLAESFGIDIGLAAMVVPVVFAGIGIVVGGPYGLGTVLAVLLVGPILGVVLHTLPEVESLWLRVPMFFGGFALLSCGITAVILAELGPGPAEVLMLAVHGKGFELARTRTAIELVSVAIGWALGGQVGAGTAFVAFAIGPTLRQLLEWSGYRAKPTDDAALCAEPGA